MQSLKQSILIVVSFFLGAIIATATGYVLAHGGNTALIHGCVRNNGLLAGFVRIVGANTNCANNETALDWNIQGPPGPQGPPGASASAGMPFVCSCSLQGATFLSGKDLTNAWLVGSSLRSATIQNTNFTNANLRSVDFRTAIVENTNFTNAEMTGANMNNLNLTTNTFVGVRGAFTLLDANISGADFSNAVLQNTNFTNNNATNTNFSGADLRTADFIGTNLTGANFTNTQRDEITWTNTICPDGTNSDNNGNTCEGHL